MNIQEILNKRAIDLTADELATVVASKILIQMELQAPKERRLLRGVKGIQEIFQCSRTKAAELKLSGILDRAIIQHNRTFLIDADMALTLVGGRANGRK